MKQRQIQLIGIVLSVLIFISSDLIPAQYHPEFAYSLIVLLTIWVPGNRSTFDASVVSTVLIIIGYFVNHRFSYLSNDLAFLILPILFVWAFTYAILKHKQTQEKLIKSTENLNAMFTHATEGIIISNIKGEIVMANPRACEQFGYEKGKLEGLSIEDLIPKRFTPTHSAHRHGYYKELNNRSMGKGINLFAMKKDGVEFPVEISLSSFRNKSELFVISFIIDITERKKQDDLIAKAQEELEQRVIDRTKELEGANNSLAKVNESLQAEMRERRKIEEALRDSERLFSTIARNFPDGIICVISQEYSIVFIDGKELDGLGWKRDQLKGRKIDAIELFSFNEEEKKKLQAVFNWESAHLEQSHNDDHYVINAVPLPDAKGFIKEILLVVQNITEIKNAEIETRTSLAKEKELNEMKSKFVSIASHEFRTPLSTILTSVSLIDKYKEIEQIEKRNKHIERIKSSVKNLTDILNDFLSLEKLEAGKTEIFPIDFEITSLCEELKEEMQAMITNGQRIEYVHEGASLVYADKQLIRHILINLVNNAIKYSNAGGLIKLSTKKNGGLTLEVQDFGIGIPKQDQVHLFERFFRAGNVTAIQGTGLGLNIVKRYVDMMNGTLKMESEENIGTTITIILPQ